MKLHIDRVDIQVSILTAVIVVLSALSVALFCYRVTYDDMIDTLQERALSIYGLLEDQLDKDTFRHISSGEDQSVPSYGAMKELLENIRNATGVRYLYTARRLDDGRLIYVIDGLDADSPDFRNPGDPIEEEIRPILEEALSDRVIMPEKIESTSWGHIFISYLPIHQGHEVIGVIGIEFDAERQSRSFGLLRIGTAAIMLAACLLAVVIAVQLFKRISNPGYRDLATTDLLTGLKNRNAFETDMKNLAAAGRRDDCALISVDLDGLKRVNDTLGHPSGDDYIRAAAAALSEAAGTAALYRVGGDEFALILRGTDEVGVSRTAAHIAQAALRRQAGGRPLSLSIGFALFDPALDRDVFDVYRRADTEMYHHKEQNRAARRA